MKILIVYLLFVAVYGKHEFYRGWKAYYVTPSTQQQMLAIRAMVPGFDLDILSHPNVDREGVILVKPEHQDGFTRVLDNNEISYKVWIEDLKANLDFDDELIENRREKLVLQKGGLQLPYDNYQQIEVIHKYLEDTAQRYPKLVTLVKAGKSFEGRPLLYLKISTTNFQNKNKPVIFIDGCIHAREWITPPVVTWAISKLVENVTEPDLLEKFDWILLPVVNPDGYKHTFTERRLWRKTRSIAHQNSEQCPGVDGNRNYDFDWGRTGVSPSPCSQIYHGNHSFSEAETKVVRDIQQENLKRIALYITMHSYGSYILYPWGHDGSASPNKANLHKLGTAVAEAIDAISLPKFPRYTVGNSAKLLGSASGAAEDYAHSIGVPLAFTQELPGLSEGAGGFILDPKYIKQVCLETWEGIVVAARMAGDMFKPKQTI